MSFGHPVHYGAIVQNQQRLQEELPQAGNAPHHHQRYFLPGWPASTTNGPLVHTISELARVGDVLCYDAASNQLRASFTTPTTVSTSSGGSGTTTSTTDFPDLQDDRVNSSSSRTSTEPATTAADTSTANASLPLHVPSPPRSPVSPPTTAAVSNGRPNHRKQAAAVEIPESDKESPEAEGVDLEHKNLVWFTVPAASNVKKTIGGAVDQHQGAKGKDGSSDGGVVVELEFALDQFQNMQIVSVLQGRLFMPNTATPPTATNTTRDDENAGAVPTAEERVLSLPLLVTPTTPDSTSSSGVRTGSTLLAPHNGELNFRWPLARVDVVEQVHAQVVVLSTATTTTTTTKQTAAGGDAPTSASASPSALQLRPTCVTIVSISTAQHKVEGEQVKEEGEEDPQDAWTLRNAVRSLLFDVGIPLEYIKVRASTSVPTNENGEEEELSAAMWITTRVEKFVPRLLRMHAPGHGLPDLFSSSVSDSSSSSVVVSVGAKPFSLFPTLQDAMEKEWCWSPHVFDQAVWPVASLIACFGGTREMPLQYWRLLKLFAAWDKKADPWGNIIDIKWNYFDPIQETVRCIIVQRFVRAKQAKRNAWGEGGIIGARIAANKAAMIAAEEADVAAELAAAAAAAAAAEPQQQEEREEAAAMEQPHDAHVEPEAEEHAKDDPHANGNQPAVEGGNNNEPAGEEECQDQADAPRNEIKQDGEGEAAAVSPAEGEAQGAAQE